MSLSKSIPIGAGIAVGLVALALVAGAMFLTDHEETLHLYQELRPGSGQSTLSFPASGPMELQGSWQGLTVLGINSPRVQQLGIGEAESGVVVERIDPASGVAARAAGLQPGDVIVGVENRPVKDLSDLYNASRRIDPLQPVLLDVRRQGQPATLVLPAASALAPPAVAEQEGGGGLGGFAAPGGGGAALPAAWAGGQAYCPRDGLMVPLAGAAPPYRCPRCQGPMQQLPQMAR